MFLYSLISIALVVPCLSVSQGYRAPSAGGYGKSFGSSLAKGASSGGFGIPFGGDDDAGGFNGIGGNGAGANGFNDGFGVDHGTVGQGYNGGLNGGHGSGNLGGFSGKGYKTGPVIEILEDDREGPIDGQYRFKFETENGISRQEEGAPNGPYGAVTQQGGWSFTLPDGTPAEFSFVADENGYRVESPLLPVPPPLPPHAIAQIEKAAQEDKLGHQGGYSDSDQGFEGGFQDVNGFNGDDGAPISQHGFQGSSKAFASGRQASQGQNQGKSYGY